MTHLIHLRDVAAYLNVSRQRAQQLYHEEHSLNLIISIREDLSGSVDLSKLGLGGNGGVPSHGAGVAANS